MPTYKASKGFQVYFKNFTDLTAAQNYFSANLGNDWSVKLADPAEQIPELTPEQKAERHQAFGQQLIKLFLADNAAFAAARGSNFTVEETQALDVKFGAFFRMCQYGSIPQIAILLPSITTDTIFTQERKDKYTALINEHLAS